jgi:CrcB protein
MTLNINTIFAVGLGGSFGAILRFYINIVVSEKFPHELPIATLTVNIIGSFLIGIFIAYFLSFHPLDTTKSFIITGFLGALTTYSTFAIESYFLFGNSILYAIINIVLNLFGTIIAAASGYKLVKYFLHI